MSTVVCSECESVRVETSRSLVLPYVCDGCSAVGDNQPAELTDETATTSATVEMISDLEEQLRVSTELNEARTELIEQLESKITSLEAENDNSLETLELLTEGIKTTVDMTVAASEDVASAKDNFDRVSEIATALMFYLGYANEKAGELEKENAALKAGVEVLERYSGLKLLAVVSES